MGRIMVMGTRGDRPMNDVCESIELTDENLRWRARDVEFTRGSWRRLSATIPDFELQRFRMGEEEPDNPHLRAVVRIPQTPAERPVPVATVSPSYLLAPHRQVAELCIKGLQKCGLDPEELKFELGLTPLGEWMNLRILLPEKYSIIDNLKHQTGLRLECFNSVDGSSRLVIVFGWIRFVCANGLIIGETMIEIRERHDGSLDLSQIPDRIANSFGVAERDRLRRLKMQSVKIDPSKLEAWVNGPVSSSWGKKAAARVHHICLTGHDAEMTDPFAKGSATEKPIRSLDQVPGSPNKATTTYDVMQALSFVAGRRTDALAQRDMLRGIDQLLTCLEPTA